MGTVYLAYHEGNSGQVAIKVLDDSLAKNQAYVARFYREARSGRLLHHPNIVRTLDVSQDRATAKHYLVMEFVDGPSAQALLQRYGRLSIADAVHIALDVARALEHAQSYKIVHRDIKPDNLLITHTGDLSDAVINGALSTLWARPAEVKARGWTEDMARVYFSLMNPVRPPVMAPDRIVSVLGRRDVILPFAGGQRLVERWGLPAENVFIWDRGHFSVPLTMIRNDGPLQRLRQIVAAL